VRCFDHNSVRDDRQNLVDRSAAAGQVQVDASGGGVCPGYKGIVAICDKNLRAMACCGEGTEVSGWVRRYLSMRGSFY
jgi:hypothetical protein